MEVLKKLLSTQATPPTLIDMAKKQRQFFSVIQRHLGHLFQIVGLK